MEEGMILEMIVAGGGRTSQKTRRKTGSWSDALTNLFVEIRIQIKFDKKGCFLIFVIII